LSYLAAAPAAGQSAFAVPEARRLTDEARRDTAALWARLVELHDGEAHTVLGYSSWHAYCKAEFGFNQSHCYRLLEAGRVAAIVPQVGNEAQARVLVPLLRDQGPEALIELLADVAREDDGRFTASQLRDAVAARMEVPIGPAADAAPAVPERPDSQPGQIYELGPHRLICGDATDPRTIATLMGDERAAMIWTDPPYGVEYEGKTAQALTIQNDGADQLRELLVGAWRAVTPAVVESAPFYVAGPTGPTAEDFLASFREATWRYQQMLIWDKQRMILGRQNYQLQHEAIYHGHGPGRNAGRMTPDRHHWHGPDNATSILRIPAPRASHDHPTMKPIKLIIPCLQHCSVPDEIVLDPFAGSGSTLIAAHTTDRRAYLVELDPRYCDVIRERWADAEAERQG
jgi:DNA modification methylase